MLCNQGTGGGFQEVPVDLAAVRCSCVCLFIAAMEFLRRKIVRTASVGKIGGISNRSVIISICVTGIILFGGTYLKISDGTAKPHVKNQWYNFYLLSGAFDSFNVPLILFDAEVLSKVIKPRREIWHDPAYTCNILCKHHPDGTNLITFAVLAHKYIPEQTNIVNRLEKVGFATHLSLIEDPRRYDSEEIEKIPSYLWIARKDHVIQIVILHDRHGDYYWAGPVTDTDWTSISALKASKQQMTIDWTTLSGVVVRRHGQAYDKSYHLTGVATKIDSHEFIVPYRINMFLKEHENSQFIECDQESADKFVQEFTSKNTDEEITFQNNARHILRITRKVLNKLKVSFWLSSGTLLGWYRQCGIIPHTTGVDIGIWIRDYRHDIIDEIEKNGLMLKNIYGKKEDSYYISFTDSNYIKLNIFFFYDEENFSWNGVTRAHDGAKFQFIFPKFTLCWTEFLNTKVRIPCETRSHIEANYGQDWKTPLKQWIWYASPPNVIPRGYWDKREWDEVIQTFEPTVKSKMWKEKDL